jgi:hypothetical protein
MPTVHVRPYLLAPVLGLALVASHAAGQSSLVVSHQKPIQPYTAEFKITTVRTLANGTTITRESTEIRAMDRDGRSLNLTKDAQANAERPAVTRAHVHDPVEGTDSNWDSVQNKATIIKAPPADQHEGCWATDSGRQRWRFGQTPQRDAAVRNVTAPPAARPKPVIEDLGTTMIEGVEAHGTRMTITTPAGEIGNDRPLVRTEENWSAPGIGQLREVSDDAQSGRHTREVVSLSLTDPDPALFQPPEGYEVTTETAHPVACE